MAIATKTVSYCVEMDALLNVILEGVKEVKAGKAATVIVIDMIPVLVGALSGLSQLSSEIADKKDLEMTVAIKVAQIMQAFT